MASLELELPGCDRKYCGSTVIKNSNVEINSSPVSIRPIKNRKISIQYTRLDQTRLDQTSSQIQAGKDGENKTEKKQARKDESSILRFF